MELLAPAGSPSALTAAVQSGADAVYIGGYKFSARRSAKNFSIEDMKRCIEYCHIRGVAVHAAANILIKENERNEFIDYIGELNDIGVDALIIQDIGMANEVKKCFPDLPLHASTQMTAASQEAVRFLEKAGFDRVVLSRELSLTEIEEICKNSTAEIEVFVHGALCVCYSGQCLMSSIIGSRSGNRGMCAQPCRLPYEIECKGKTVDKGYLLSPKDLALIDELDALEKAGVTSLKIEGRLKRPEYVAAVTSTYCKYKSLTGSVTSNDWDILKNAFNRSGFTKGYFICQTGRKMMSTQTPGNVSNNSFSEEIIKLSKTDANVRLINIDAYAVFKENEVLELTFTDSDYNCVTVKGDIKAEKAENKSLSKERLKEQILKLGNTPFNISNIEIYADEQLVLPISEINNVRRKAVARLEKARAAISVRRRNNTCTCECKVQKLDKPIFSAQVKSFEQAQAVLEFDIPIIYAPEKITHRIKHLAPEREVITVLPPIQRKRDRKKYHIEDGVMVSNIGQLEYFSGVRQRGGMRLNIYNNKSIEFYKDLKSVSISPELNIREIKALKQYTPLEITVYGRLPLMVLENCPAKMYAACGSGAYLKDRRNEKFPLFCAEGCYCEILNSKPVYMADKAEDLKALPVDIYKLNFTIETLQECRKILSDYKNAFLNNAIHGKPEENSFTRGHYYRGVE